VPIGRIHTLQHQCPRWHCTNGCAACSGDRKFHVEFHPTTYSLNRCGTGCMMMASRQLQFTTASKQCVECNHSSFAQAMLCKPTVVLFITFYAIISCDLVTLPSASCAACCHRCYVWLFTTDTLDVRLDLILSWFLLSVSQSVAQSVSQSVNHVASWCKACLLPDGHGGGCICVERSGCSCPRCSIYSSFRLDVGQVDGGSIL
jgi:hypothetical protein